MEIDLRISDMREGKKLFITLSFDGEKGVGRKRLRWIDGGKLVERLGAYIYSKEVDPYIGAMLLADLARYAKRFTPDGKARKCPDTKLDREMTRLVKRIESRGKRSAEQPESLR